MPWKFTADGPENLVQIRHSLPSSGGQRAERELVSMAKLLEALGKTSRLEFPVEVRHTGEDAVPDFQVHSGSRKIAVEMALVASQPLEQARKLQGKLSKAQEGISSMHFRSSDIRDPRVFTFKLRMGADKWARMVVDRLPVNGQRWLSDWDGQADVPVEIQQLFVNALNAIIDGPPTIHPPPAQTNPSSGLIEDWCTVETPRDRRAALEATFYEELPHRINPTLMVTNLVTQKNQRMKRGDIVQKGFLGGQFPGSGATSTKILELWVERTSDEVKDKSDKLKGTQFQHGDEDWLVLWIQLGTLHSDRTELAKAVGRQLAPLWQPNWFSRVFVQSPNFEWQLMFASSGFEFLPLAEDWFSE